MIKFVVMKKRTLLTLIVACIALLGVFAWKGLDAPIKPQAQNQWLSEPFQGITAYDELMRAIDTHAVCLKNTQCLPINDLTIPTVYLSLGYIKELNGFRMDGSYKYLPRMICLN